MHYPKCMNCKYILLDRNSGKDNMYKYAKCSKYVDVDLVSGEILPKCADVCRSSELLCGEKGNGYKYDMDRDVKWEVSMLNTKNISNTITILIPYFALLFSLLIFLLVHHTYHLRVN